MAEELRISPIIGKDNDSLYRWARDTGTRINEFMRQSEGIGAFFVWEKGSASIPQNTTISGALEIIFSSNFVGNGSIVITGVGFSGGVTVALNGTEITTLSNADLSNEIVYEVSVTNLVEGLNSFKIWDTAGDSASLRKIEVWRNFNYAVIGGVSPADGTFLVGNGTGFVGESGSTVRNSIGAGIDEANTFFQATDISGSEAETLTDGSDAQSLHTHEFYQRYALMVG